MTARYVQNGKTIDYTPTAFVSAGAVVVQDSLVGVAKLEIEANTLGALAVVGVFEMPKASSEIACGAKVYWDGLAVTTQDDDGEDTPTAYPYVGKTISSASASDIAVRVRLEQ